MRSDLALGTAVTLVCLSVAGCGGSKTAVDTASTAPSSASAAASTNPYGVPSIDPAAPDEPILTVKGGSTPLSLTLGQLNALGEVSVTIDEPFVKKRQTFRGVPIAVVLDKAGIPDTATIDTVALNDYHYSGPAEPMIASQGLIATERDGAPIPYDQGGPIRIVYPDGTPMSQAMDAWNWSLASITTVPPPPKS